MAADGGGSRRAREARRQERMLREQWQSAWRQAQRWSGASEAERGVLAQFLVLTTRGWRLLVERRWPLTSDARADVMLVGPGGMFVIDVKDWPAVPTVVDGTLRAGEAPRPTDTSSAAGRRAAPRPAPAGRTTGGGRPGPGGVGPDAVASLLAATRSAERAVAGLGLSPVAVHPLMVFAAHRLDSAAGRVRLLGGREVGPALLSERGRLGARSVRAIADDLERAFPGYVSATADPPARTPRSRPRPKAPEGLFDLAGLRDAAREEALRAPIEQWMSFLDPSQLALVRRDWSGPARISGAAGTGKTVVGLHRAAYLARRTTGRLLYVTYANNLPRVQGTFLATMSPAVADRVDFRSLHSWAREFLRERGVPVRLHGEKAATAFSLAWKRVGRDSRLAEIDPAPGYWEEEIGYVIKGRGLTTFEEYATVPRRRRRTSLRRPHREAVWALYEAYEALRVERGVHDFNDVLSLALAEATRATDRPRYAGVIADEVQDLSLVGVRLLHAVVGDVPNGLLLVGDGQQAVYPGGFRLTDAGIDIRGDRGQVLRTNYRNSEQILTAALQVVADDAFEDIDGVRTPGRRDVDLTYHDGQVLRIVEPTVAAHDQALLAALRALPAGGHADVAVLCPSRHAIDHYRALLTQAGIPVCPLDRYDGRPVDAVKLGTYRRAKGLEFKRVYLPRYDTRAPNDPPAGGPTVSEASRERAELRRSQLFVAMTRARDVLWLGRVSG
ncbi:UvrD-helicase domain-containing protein [Streptomyces sp. NPDC057702]|uniref:UvrD-helicase domain-containing protein n=1 Tax=unclassified Streptomyces TaxID=2593676 RepID=UPI0036CF51C7